jgi:hypothetical protein
MTNDEILSLTPEQAGEALAAMRPAAPVAAGPAPDTLSPSAARERLEGLKQNPEWQRRFLDASGPTLREYNELSARAAEPGDRLEAAFAYDLQTAPPFETSYNGELNTWQTAKVVAALREFGLSDDNIREMDANVPIAKELHDAARRLQQQRHADPQWVDRLLKGGDAEKRELLLIKILLRHPVAEAA